MPSALLLLFFLQSGTPAPSPYLPRIPWPKANQFQQAKSDLGRALFFDARLASDNKTPCAACHVPVRAFGSSRPIPPLPGGREGQRHAPTLINRAYGRSFGWDGRHESLEAAIAAHFLPRGLMGQPMEDAVAALQGVPGYQPLFQAAFGGSAVDSLSIRQALATWIRTLNSGVSAYDRFMAGDREAMSAAATRGKDLFLGKANCAACHKPPLFTTEEFACNGAGAGNPPDEGRAAVTRQERDYRVFRIPSLREAARSAPYFHDGSQSSLEDVISFYDRGELSENPDPRLKPLRLSEQEKRDLLEFLQSLSSERLPFSVEPPTLP
jgi:cytochrome c peroxidase